MKRNERPCRRTLVETFATATAAAIAAVLIDNAIPTAVVVAS
ncbi:hypothetical protein [Mycobacterium sp. 852002-51057_SCH5723018]|nr:hypothetical protein [Mycobacterium sp. 852002-51057_SCH5723018]